MQTGFLLRHSVVRPSANPFLLASCIARRARAPGPWQQRSLTLLRRSPPTRPFSTFPALPTREPKRAASSYWTIAAILLFIGGGKLVQDRYFDPARDAPQKPILDDSPSVQQSQEPFLGVIDLLETMPVDLPPGTVGNLTREQEVKLREFWTLALKAFGINLDSPDEPASQSQGLASIALSAGDDKHGQSKEFQQALADMSADEFRTTFWNMVKHDNPDSLFLRFLRARKWDVKKAFIMFISTIRWRSKEIQVDNDVMKNGEGFALKQSQSSDPAEKKKGDDFLFQMRKGKSYLHGVDKAGRPICVVRVRLHKAADQSEEALQRYTVYLIESTRMMLAPPIETATIIFDMTNFGMANMDYAPVKFMIKCFEANYPESLGAVLVHKAPWIFSGFWSIIKGWLDPVVAGKIHFTKSASDLEKFIPLDRVPKELDGKENWEYEYVDPKPEENKKMEDTATRDSLLAERQEIAKELQKVTISWLKAHSGQDKEAISASEEKRSELISKLRHHYWQLDPYIRSRSFYDRTNVIQEGGKIQFYPESSK